MLVVSRTPFSRAAAVACALLMDTLQCCVQDALALVKDALCAADMHPYYVAQLAHWYDGNVALRAAASQYQLHQQQ